MSTYFTCTEITSSKHNWVTSPNLYYGFWRVSCSKGGKHRWDPITTVPSQSHQRNLSCPGVSPGILLSFPKQSGCLTATQHGRSEDDEFCIHLGIFRETKPQTVQIERRLRHVGPILHWATLPNYDYKLPQRQWPLLAKISLVSYGEFSPVLPAVGHVNESLVLLCVHGFGFTI